MGFEFIVSLTLFVRFFFFCLSCLSVFDLFFFCFVVFFNKEKDVTINIA